MAGPLKVWAALLVLVLAPGCNAVCGEGATCENNFRVDCRDRGELWGGNNQVHTNCGSLTCVDFGNDAKCVLGGGKDPLCPAKGTHELCDGAIYYSCQEGYRTAQKDCGAPTACVPGRRGCSSSTECTLAVCSEENSGCSENELPHTCRGDVLWTCTGDRLTFHSDCDRVGLNCHADLAECALP
jgi:hypothetical protein